MTAPGDQAPAGRAAQRAEDRVVVVGDVLLDRDLLGSVERVAPDAPAPVLDVTADSARPGGAGLAATLLAADGLDVTLVAPLAADAGGDLLRGLLARAGVHLHALPTRSATREKVRLRAGGTSIARYDVGGSACPPTDDLPGSALHGVLDGAAAVLVSDYGGGTTGHASVRAALSDVVATGVPVCWDPHPRGAPPVPGARLVTPNRAEAGASADLRDISDRAAALVRTWAASAVAVTAGDRGAVVSYGSGSPAVIPAGRRVDSGDPCGAGDRFASAATAALARGALPTEAVAAAVEAATAFVAAGGAAALGRATGAGAAADDVGTADPHAVVAAVRAAGGTVVATGGCFDLLHAGHVATLEAARALGDCLVVCLNSDSSVRRLKGPGRPLVPEADRARVLTALGCVGAVAVFDEDTPERLLRDLRPDIWAKGGDYAHTELPESAALAEWGGRAVVLPYVDGRSTTRLLETARRRGDA